MGRTLLSAALQLVMGFAVGFGRAFAKVKSGGQECPPHIGRRDIYAFQLAVWACAESSAGSAVGAAVSGNGT